MRDHRSFLAPRGRVQQEGWDHDGLCAARKPSLLLSREMHRGSHLCRGYCLEVEGDGSRGRKGTALMTAFERQGELVPFFSLFVVVVVVKSSGAGTTCNFAALCPLLLLPAAQDALP